MVNERWCSISLSVDSFNVQLSYIIKTTQYALFSTAIIIVHSLPICMSTDVAIYTLE